MTSFFSGSSAMIALSLEKLSLGLAGAEKFEKLSKLKELCFRKASIETTLKFNSLPVRGLTESTREGKVPVWGVKCV